MQLQTILEFGAKVLDNKGTNYSKTGLKITCKI